MAVSILKRTTPYKLVNLDSISLPSGVSRWGSLYYIKLGRIVQLHLNLKIESTTKRSFTISNVITTDADRPVFDTEGPAGDGTTNGFYQPFAVKSDGGVGFWNTVVGTTYLQGTVMYISKS